MATTKKELIASLIEQAQSFRFCGPSDDPDEQTSVTSGYRYLVVQFKRLVGPLLPEEPANRLNSINVEIDDLYSAYDAKAELDALIPDIEAALEFADEAGKNRGAPIWIVESGLIAQLAEKKSTALDVGTLVKMCKEINSSYAHGNILATALLMRTVLNHVPPVFGHDSFAQVVASAGKSLKENLEHLENGLRKIADFHAHRKIVASESYPSVAQVEPFRPQFELLLQQVETRLSAK
jgi:hypothetical protein